MRTFLKTLPRRSALVARTSTLLAVAACLGCSSGSDESGDGGGQVAIAPLSREPTSKGVTFDSAQLSLALVSLEACAADTATLNTRNFPIELLHQPAPHVIFVSAVTDYCSVGVDLAPAGPSDLLPDLQGYTVLFRGTRADGAAFELRSTLNTSFVFESGTLLAADKLVVGVDLEQWLSDVDLDAATTTDDVALVDADDNPDQLAAFDAAVRSAFALYEDTNGDGALSDSELTPVATAAAATTE
jgi:hypothetical protein